MRYYITLFILLVTIKGFSQPFLVSDSLADFGMRYVGTTTDRTFLFINPKSPAKPYVVEQIGLSNGPDFSKFSISRPLPFTVNPGDTLAFTVRFTCNDTAVHYDTVYVKTDCDLRKTVIRAEGGIGILVASDHDFGKASVMGQYPNSVRVDTISVTNLGKLPITVTNSIYFTRDSVFAFDNIISGNRDYPLPFEIKPKQKVRLRFFYYPLNEGLDTATVVLLPDYPIQCMGFGKPFVHLKGTGVRDGVEWDRDLLVLSTSSDTVIKRVYLRATRQLPTKVDNIFIDGPNDREFFIHSTQRPLEGGIVIDPGDSVWIDIGFYPDRDIPDYLERQAFLKTAQSSNPSDTNTLRLIGHVNSLSVGQELEKAVCFYPNPVMGSSSRLMLSIKTAATYSFAIIDVLGNEIFTIPSTFCDVGEQIIDIPTSKLPEGAYILRVSDGVLTKSINFRVVK